MVYTSPMLSPEQKNTSGRLVHEFLAHSYFIYLAAVVIGFGADLLWPVQFSFPFQQPIGFVAIILGTMLAVWAQYSSGSTSGARNIPTEDIQHHHFRVGPYSFTRTPTQYGLSLMVVGLAVLYGFFFMLVTAVIAFIAGKWFYIPKQEHHLEQKYGAPYLEYKKKVKF